MRRRLVAYFARKRHGSPDDLADETLNRVARRLQEEGAIEDAPARYCYIVARFVFLESLRTPPLQPYRDVDAPASTPNEPERSASLDCLERSLAILPPADRDLILEYYRGETGTKIQQRRELAARRGLSPNALAIRASRLRDKLEEAVLACLAGR
jgi:DNA-directed RNA polymerase specialized sigma24 family protein